MIDVRVIWEGLLVERHRFICEDDALQYFEDRQVYMVEGEAIQVIEGDRILVEYSAA